MKAMLTSLEIQNFKAVAESVKGVLTSTLGSAVEVISESEFRAEGVSVGVIPMGLHGDQQLGIRNHSMEDYLIKLVLENESLRPNVPEFHPLMANLLGTIRGEPYSIPFDSSKDVFQLFKPIIKHGLSDTGVVESLFENADPHILRSVMDPLLSPLQRAADA